MGVGLLGAADYRPRRAAAIRSRDFRHNERVAENQLDHSARVAGKGLPLGPVEQTGLARRAEQQAHGTRERRASRDMTMNHLEIDEDYVVAARRIFTREYAEAYLASEVELSELDNQWLHEEASRVCRDRLEASK